MSLIFICFYDHFIHRPFTNHVSFFVDASIFATQVPQLWSFRLLLILNGNFKVIDLLVKR